MTHPANFYDRTGIRYGNLTVLRYAGQTKNKKSKWLCRCDCGVNMIASGAHLHSESVASCGCFGNERQRNAISTHRDTSRPEYKSWASMKERCLNSKSKDYSDYGGRGIKVCERWMNSYESFLADMGRKPTPKHSIDRYPNNDGNYEPTNCRWATMKEQSNNRRSNHCLTHEGQTHSISTWAEIKGIGKTTIRERLRRGWAVHAALTLIPNA